MESLQSKFNIWFDNFKFPLVQLYLVGGTVRDLMLGRDSADIDLVCLGACLFAKKLATEKNAAFVPMEKKADSPCYRVVNRKNSLDFLDIAEIKEGTIESDLALRDFTINAMALPLKGSKISENIIDPFHGADDLKNKKIQRLSESTFISDPLRILRAVRFAAQLGFEIEGSTQKDMRDKARLLKNVSAERIIFELMKILESDKSICFFREMDELGILEIIFPEILPMKNCSQNDYHHTDVWNHSLIAMEECEALINNAENFSDEFIAEHIENLKQNSQIPLLKLAALLHDMAKPRAQSLNEENGRITFHGHDKIGAEMMFELAERMRLSKASRDFLCMLVSEHLHVRDLAKDGVKRGTLIKWIRKFQDNIVPIFILSIADIRAARGPLSNENEKSLYEAWVQKNIANYYRDLKKKFEKKNLVTGKDLMDLGIKPSPLMGKVLAQIRQAQDEGSIDDREAALEMARNFLKTNP